MSILNCFDFITDSTHIFAGGYYYNSGYYIDISRRLIYKLLCVFITPKTDSDRLRQAR